MTYSTSTQEFMQVSIAMIILLWTIIPFWIIFKIINKK